MINTDLKRAFVRSAFSLLLFVIALACVVPLTTAQTTPEQVAGSAASEPQTTETMKPADEPLYRDYKGVRLGMSVDEVRQKLGSPTEKDKTQDFFLFSDKERARVYYDDRQKARAIIVTYIGKSSNAPASKDVLGMEVSANADGSVYKLIRYPEAGCWVAYSRTAGDEPLTIITIQKM